MNSEKSFKKDSSQYNFVLSELKSDAAKNARYIIVIIHNPFLSCQCSHDAREFSTYHSIFSTYGVNLVLQAHNHNVQYYKVDSIIYQVSGAAAEAIILLDLHQNQHSFKMTIFMDSARLN